MWDEASERLSLSSERGLCSFFEFFCGFLGIARALISFENNFFKKKYTEHLMHLPVHFTFDPTIIYNNIMNPYCLFIKKQICSVKLSLGVNKKLKILSSVTPQTLLTTPQLQSAEEARGTTCADSHLARLLVFTCLRGTHLCRLPLQF